MINIVGLGPGARDYILPVAIRIIKSAELVVGAERNLESIKEHNSNIMNLNKGLSTIGEFLSANKQKNIAVVVSGDSGFYSMVNFISKYVEKDYLIITPGISSLQYMYSKLKRGYEDCKWVSLHGREKDIRSYLLNRIEIGILTDEKHNNRYIGQIIKDLGLENVKVHVGERLSYSDEKVSSMTVDQCINYVSDSLSVVVITYE